MDYADNFTPKPIKGEKYTAKDGKIVIVDDIQPDEGVVYVFCHYEGDEPNTMFPNKEEWESMFSLSDDIKYSIQLSVNPIDGGTVTGSGLYDKDTDITISATPSNGFRFVKWSDNNTLEQRNLTVTNNLQLEARFEQIASEDSSIKGGAGEATHGEPTDSANGGNSSDTTNDDTDFNEYLHKVIEPINRLKKLLQHGVTLPFQILKLESDEEIPAQFSDPNVTNTCQDKLNKIEALRKEGEKIENRGSWIEEKMWSFGAFDKPMLRMFKQDHGPKTGLGAAIFMTSLLAFCTGTYAFYKISDNTFLSFVMGMIWGSMIYVLDRNIVTSMAYIGKRHRMRHFFKSCCTVGLRLVISVFIGIVISTPIEMLIFSGKIDEYKNFEHEQFVKNEIAKQENRLAKDLLQNRDELNKQLSEITQTLTNEENDPHARGRGDDYREYKEIERKIRNAIIENENKIKGLRETYQTNSRDYKEAAEKKWKQQEDYFDLSTDLAILYKVTSTVEELDKIAKRERESIKPSQSADLINDKATDKDSKKNNSSSEHKQQSLSTNSQQAATNPNVTPQIEQDVINPALPRDNTMHNCRVFITIFFILLEIIPVITKLFFKAGDYDKEMVRWSYLKAKLHRIQDANSYNQIINGALTRHRKYILGEEFEDIEKALQSDENHEGDNLSDSDNITLPIKGCLRTAQDYNDWRNLNRWKFAIKKADDYLEEEINKLFPQIASTNKSSQPVQPQQPQSLSTPADPSAGGETID